jgi:hypothetical protein
MGRGARPCSEGMAEGAFRYTPRPKGAGLQETKPAKAGWRSHFSPIHEDAFILQPGALATGAPRPKGTGLQETKPAQAGWRNHPSPVYGASASKWAGAPASGAFGDPPRPKGTGLQETKPAQAGWRNHPSPVYGASACLQPVALAPGVSPKLTPISPRW